MRELSITIWQGRIKVVVCPRGTNAARRRGKEKARSIDRADDVSRRAVCRDVLNLLSQVGDLARTSRFRTSPNAFARESDPLR